MKSFSLNVLWRGFQGHCTCYPALVCSTERPTPQSSNTVSLTNQTEINKIPLTDRRIKHVIHWISFKKKTHTHTLYPYVSTNTTKRQEIKKKKSFDIIFNIDTNLSAGCPSSHADEERLPVMALIFGLVTWLCLAVGRHASSAARRGPLTHRGCLHCVCAPPIWWWCCCCCCCCCWGGGGRWWWWWWWQSFFFCIF